MGTVFGAIADDFTGATDLAGLLARSGVPVSLRIGVPDTPPVSPAPLEVIALKSRTVSADRAVSEAQKALSWLRATGATRFFWKYCSTFDSTPEGNIGPVAEALMDDLGISQTIYCPAFPENGRLVFMGNLFVGELPLSESPMRDHPLTPMQDSNLMRLLTPQVTRPVGLINRQTVAKGAQALRIRLADLATKGVAHVVVDAITDDDLSTIADACGNMMLMTGGSAVAMPLPLVWQDSGLLCEATGAVQHKAPSGGAIILSGSCSAMTQAQVADFIVRGGPALQLCPIELATNGVAPALGWLRDQPAHATPLIYASAQPEAVQVAQDRLGAAEAGAIVEKSLATLAVAACKTGRSRFIVAGGETSGAITQALGVDRLDVGVEIAPGVPWCFAQSDGKPIAMALKSGNFGTEAFFSEALDVLAWKI